MSELTDKIAELMLENDRIKKTSKQRFENNKKLKSEFKYLNLELSRVKVIRKFLVDNGFKLEFDRGQFSVSYSVISAIKSLTEKSVANEKPSVDGVYSIKVDGVWRVVKIEYRLCWMIIDNETENPSGIHNYNISEFVLLEADK